MLSNLLSLAQFKHFSVMFSTITAIKLLKSNQRAIFNLNRSLKTRIMNKPHIFGIILISFTMTSYLIGVSSPKRINSTTPVQSEDAEPRLKNQWPIIIMEIQLVLTYFINFVALSSIILFLLDFSLFLAKSWHQLHPSDSAPDFYQQVKDVFWDDELRLLAWGQAKGNR